MQLFRLSALLLITAFCEAAPQEDRPEEDGSSVTGFIFKVFSLLDSYDTAPYTVTNTFEEGVEERVYPSKKWVCNLQTKSAAGENMSSLFWSLFQYIQGDNNDGIKIPMTVPVATLSQGDDMEMCFYIGEHYQANPSVPTNSAVYIKTQPERKILTWRIGGFMNADKWQIEKERLRIKLSQLGLTFLDDKYYFVGYDSPFKWFFRRNEVWFLTEE